MNSAKLLDLVGVVVALGFFYGSIVTHDAWTGQIAETRAKNEAQRITDIQESVKCLYESRLQTTPTPCARSLKLVEGENIAPINAAEKVNNNFDNDPDRQNIALFLKMGTPVGLILSLIGKLMSDKGKKAKKIRVPDDLELPADEDPVEANDD